MADKYPCLQVADYCTWAIQRKWGTPSTRRGTMGHMGRWTPKHTDEQRQAVIRAQLEDGLSAEEAVALASTGELWPEPFEMSATQARELARQARRKGQSPIGNGHPPDDPELATARAVIQEVSKLGAKASNKDLARARTARAIIADWERRAARSRPARPATADGEPSDLAKRLKAHNEAGTRPDLDARRNQLATRWVKATFRMTRDHNQAAQGRPRRLEQEWRDLGGNRPGSSPSYDLPAETYERLNEQLDREETELAELENQAQHHP